MALGFPVCSALLYLLRPNLSSTQIRDAVPSRNLLPTLSLSHSTLTLGN